MILLNDCLIEKKVEKLRRLIDEIDNSDRLIKKN